MAIDLRIGMLCCRNDACSYEPIWHGPVWNCYACFSSPLRLNYGRRYFNKQNGSHITPFIWTITRTSMNPFYGKLRERWWLLPLLLCSCPGMWSCNASRYLCARVPTNCWSVVVWVNPITGENRVCIVWIKRSKRMVRRWSYINSLNSFDPVDCYVAHKSAFDTIINSTMYLRKDFTLVTELRRRRWARRKHLHTWIPLMNILHNWASMYRFYKNYLKTTLNQLLFKNSFVALNLLRSRNSLPCLFKGSELVVTSSLVRKSLKYFSYHLNHRLRFFSKQNELNTLLVSIPDVSQVQQGFPDQAKSLLVNLTDNVDSWSHPSSLYNLNQGKSKQLLLSTLTQMHALTFSHALPTYKVLVLLLLRHIQQNA